MNPSLIGDKPHGDLEDICGEIGYTATCLLVDWFGGSSLYIPESPSEGHTIERVIGRPAFLRLVKAYGNSNMKVPLDYQREITRRNKAICQLLSKGDSPREVAKVVCLTERSVQKAKVMLEELGLLPTILGSPGLFDEKTAGAPPKK